MKRAFLLSSAALACALSVPAQAADTLAKVAADNKITFAYRDSSVPFSYLAGADKPIGLGVDISNAVLAAVQKALGKTDIQVGWQSVTSANRIPLLVNGTIDLECGSTTNNSARGKEVSFATNYFYTGSRLMVKKSSGIQNWADLRGKKVAITTGTTNMQVVRRYSEEKGLGLDIIATKDHADAALLVEEGVALLWAPDVATMYPGGHATHIEVAELGADYCGAARPGHFDGVATVVAKLFNQVRPDVAIFGEKDWQQLAIIRRMARDLDFALDILGAPIARDGDGLALSSRNAYLSPEQRAAAAAFPDALKAAVAAIAGGADVAETLADAEAAIIAGGFDSVDYVALADADSLERLTIFRAPARLLAAARMGKTRLIDNYAVD